MIRIDRISTFANEGTGRAHTVFRTVAAQPSWITRIALATFLLVIGLPIMLLFMLALICGVMIFGVLSLVNALLLRLKGSLPSRPDGRENVRVIRRL